MLEERKREGVVKDVRYAFSRDSGDDRKYYVTDALKDAADLVWEVWKDQDSALFFCGPGHGIAQNVRSVMEEVSMERLGKPAEACAKFCKKHKWIIETFG
jgi:sulfite reductase alpha subunit-like flavoprotein